MKEPTPCPSCGQPRTIRSKGYWGGKQRFKAYCIPCENKRIASNSNARVSANKSKRLWDKKNPEKRRAQKAVENALLRGDLKRKPCERCGSRNSQAHHDDYAKPLDVIWLCAKDHKIRHRELRTP